MQLFYLTWPLMALVAMVIAAGPTVTVYKDLKCKQVSQVIQMSAHGPYHCYNFHKKQAPAVRFSTTGFQNRAWGVWDADYCDADTVGSTAKFLGKCIRAKDFGLTGWNTAHDSPYNGTGF